MFLDMQPGSLMEPLTGRLWNQQEVIRQYFERMRFLLAQGIEVGDRVFFHHGNTLEFFVDLLAVWSCGGCAVPIDSRLTPFEVETLAGAANPRFFLHGKSGDSAVIAAVSQLGVRALDTSGATLSGGKVEALGSTVSRLTLDQPALILFTSGTTGRPKGVVHTHRSLRARWITLKQCLGLSQFRKTLCLLPTHFGHGLICNCLFPWLSGQALHILPPFRSDLIVQLGALIDEHKITFLSSVPTVWHLALKLSKRPQLGNA